MRTSSAMEVVEARVEDGLLAGLLDLLGHIRLGLVEHLLDARGMDAAVLDEALERDAADLAADRVEAREDDCLRRVVDDQVDAGELLEGADVAALAADDAALHVVAGDVNDRHGGLGGVVGRDTLDGDARRCCVPSCRLPRGLGSRSRESKAAASRLTSSFDARMRSTSRPGRQSCRRGTQGVRAPRR